MTPSPRKRIRTARVAALAAAVSIVATAAASAAPAAAAVTPANASANAKLTATVDAYSATLAIPQNVSAKVAAANLPAAVAGAITAELSQLYQCDAVTRAATSALFANFPYGPGLPIGFPGVFPFPVQTQGATVLGVPVTMQPLPDPQLPVNFPFQPQVAKCGQASVTALKAIQTALKANPTSSTLDLWPILSFQPGTAGHHTYANDYVLLVDEGSNNTFLNNAGGNELDVYRGPAGSPAPIIGPARGCIDAFDIVRAHTCTLSAAALLDPGSYNTYGAKTRPDPATDGMCTASPLESRTTVQGSGLAGVGILVDEGSHNTFIGKVLTDGAGQVGGYGYMEVDGNDNTFTAIRDAFGASVVGGIGTFVLNGNGNTFSTYMPSAIIPFAPAGTLGSGGVVDDVNNCDAGTGLTLGAGEVGGVGIFTAHSTQGNSYDAPQQSLGSGLVLGKGTFTTTGGGNDAYTGAGGAAAGRGNNTTVQPTSTDNGMFSDS
jgi:hypothetical protein